MSKKDHRFSFKDNILWHTHRVKCAVTYSFLEQLILTDHFLAKMKKPALKRIKMTPEEMMSTLLSAK